MRTEVLKVYYSDDDYDAAIKGELQKLGVEREYFRAIIAIPKSLTRILSCWHDEGEGMRKGLGKFESKKWK